ncbi:MAG TPA: dihydrofolate reductase [Patescibacteria group bacterium]|nr:dihydrofolate reductase [Patescibacteria group bacterium]
MLALIAAVAANGIIGKNNELPWHLPKDLRHFKSLTVGHTVLMGRKTFESILARLGKPLPDRKNIVITHQPDYQTPEGVLVYPNLSTALETHADEKIFVIGGAEIYRETFGLCDVLEITHVNQKVQGDVTFPKIDCTVWSKLREEKHEGFSFATYVRRGYQNK